MSNEMIISAGVCIGRDWLNVKLGGLEDGDENRNVGRWIYNIYPYALGAYKKKMRLLRNVLRFPWRVYTIRTLFPVY